MGEHRPDRDLGGFVRVSLTLYATTIVVCGQDSIPVRRAVITAIRLGLVHPAKAVEEFAGRMRSSRRLHRAQDMLRIRIPKQRVYSSQILTKGMVTSPTPPQ